MKIIFKELSIYKELEFRDLSPDLKDLLLSLKKDFLKFDKVLIVSEPFYQYDNYYIYGIDLKKRVLLHSYNWLKKENKNEKKKNKEN